MNSGSHVSYHTVNWIRKNTQGVYERYGGHTDIRKRIVKLLLLYPNTKAPFFVVITVNLKVKGSTYTEGIHVWDSGFTLLLYKSFLTFNKEKRFSFPSSQFNAPTSQSYLGLIPSKVLNFKIGECIFSRPTSTVRLRVYHLDTLV